MQNSVIRRNKEAGPTKWLLEVNKDPKKFLVTNLSAFIPYGKGPDAKMLFNGTSGLVDTLFISKHKTVLNAAMNDIDRKNIDVLIQHPDVKLPDLPKEEWDNLVHNRLKKANPGFILKNLDWQEDEEYENDVRLISLRYWLVQTEDPISLKRAIFLASYLGVNYFEESRYYDHTPEVLRKKIIKNIDKKIARSSSALEKLIKVKDDTERIEKFFFIRKLIEKGVITFSGQLYYLGKLPIGPDEESLLHYFDQNIESFNAYKKEIIEEKKGTALKVIGEKGNKQVENVFSE